VVVVDRLDGSEDQDELDLPWQAFVGGRSTECDTAWTRADDPLMLLYTSGTTGRPKGAVHSHCGFPIKAAQDMMHAHDVHAGETMYWVSDIGWMMGPWEVFGMALLGGTSVIYDGALDYPGPDRLRSLVARHGVNILGVSPTLIRSLMRHGDEPVRRHDLRSLRILGSTGEPWNPEPWRWFFDVAGGGLCRSSTTPAAPRCRAGSWPATCSRRSSRRRSPGRRRESPRTWSTIRAGRYATVWANWSCARRGSA
jgi:acetyl-CoA synthetase